MTKGSLLFDVGWRSLNSPFGDWLKTRSYRTVCQISTFSYYSPLNFCLSLFYNKRKGMFSYSSIFYSSFKDHKQLTKELDCECVRTCTSGCDALLLNVSSLGPVTKLQPFKYLTEASKESFLIFPVLRYLKQITQCQTTLIKPGNR